MSVNDRRRWNLAAVQTTVAISAFAVLAGSVSAMGKPIELEIGNTVSGDLETDDVDQYSVDLGDGYFVFGSANQVSVDVVVKVFDESGDLVGEYDGPGRGHETFQFDSDKPGTYLIEVTPFEDEEGEYEISLRRAEPVATTPEGRVDQLMAAYDDPNTPGGVVAVVQGGKLSFARAYGAADLSYGVPFETDTLTNIGSTSKQFTCYAILLLQKQGKLSIEDNVRDYIPELPDFGEVVRIKHLMSHTSGYREFLNTLALTGRSLSNGDYIDRSEIISIIQRQPELQDSPGEKWNYNNSGYGLLATIVERVSEESFRDWMQSNVFLKLGMRDTFVRGDSSSIVQRLARGYSPSSDDEWRESADLDASIGAGGIYTTVGDLAKWVRNYKTGLLGGNKIIDQMTTPFVLNDGSETDYGFGLFMDDWRGLDRIHHGGADSAHRSEMTYFPSLDAAVITQSNNAGFDGSITNAVAEAFFSEHIEEKDAPDAPPGEVAEVDPADFEGMAGEYEMEDFAGFILTFTREGDTYYAQATGQSKIEMAPVSSNEFVLIGVEAKVEFHVGDDGQADSITLHQNGAHKAKRLSEDAEEATDEQLEQYCGRFFSEELEVFYDITLENGELQLNQRRFANPVKLTGGNEHRFMGCFPVAQVEFDTDESGEFNVLIVSNGRTKGVHFE